MNRVFILNQTVFLVGLLLFTEAGYAQCNGDVALCDKRYDQVVYVTTHNGYNYSPTFQLPNQSYPVSQQMVDGVRAFMLDVYDVFGTPTLYHSLIALGSEPLEDVLIDIKDFLQANPNEVLTIIFEANISASDMETVFTSSGLNSYLRAQPLGQPWPTLQQLIDLNERLVVFSDVDDGGPGQEWYHYMWDHCVETDYANNSQADFSCDFNRGDSVNSLFILNHFITNQFTGTGELDSSIIANSNPYFLNRANQCIAEKGKLPNFLTVDFYDVGDVFDTKDQLNANFVSVESVGKETLQMSVFPNPSTHSFKISLTGANSRDLRLEVRDLAGRVKASYQGNEVVNKSLEIYGNKIGKGMFFIELWQHRELLAVEKIVLL
ncbi:MAG TPA: phosphatidylinositol-specific phospholipase C domain-containing protein [Flavobacteriales bacterium]|nr:phosphatidylinositol-specific phospholipase C domain-containing protein [Flavobacteriales bacterium]HIO68302.1 phosphatidylinositol-specific phospholipase C domain-containing protein [Flavobacteriales bacterium]